MQTAALITLLTLACAHPVSPAGAPSGAPEAGLTATGTPGEQAQITPPPTGLGDQPVGRPQPPQAVPPADSPATPPLSGSTEAMVIEGLTHSTLEFTVGADLSPLALIDQDEAQVLATHLAAHPMWRVTRWEGATVAMLRQDDPQQGRTVPWAGYHQQDGDIWRALLRLSPRLPGAEWTNSPLVERFEPDDDVLSIHAWQPAGAGWYKTRGAAIAVVGKVATLEIHELSTHLELNAMSAAMKWSTTDLLSLDKFTQDTNEDAQPWGWLPPGEPTSDAAGVYVVPTDDGVDIHGRLNPGAAGWTWARITDPQGLGWLETLTAAATLERIGWSDRDDQRFWFQGRVPTDIGLPPGSAVELWFLADGAKEAQQIGRWATGA